MSIITSPSQVKKDNEVKALVKDSTLLLDFIRDFKIIDLETQCRAIELIKEIKVLRKNLDEKRKFYTVPLDQLQKIINKDFKIVIDPLVKTEYALRKDLELYNDKLKEAAQKEEEKLQKKIEKAVEKGKPIPVVPDVSVNKHIKTDNASMTMIKEWKYEIENEEIIPNEYKIVDTAKISRVVKTGIREIPGIKIYYVERSYIR